MLHRTLASLLMVIGLSAYAQTIFIPDSVLRVALNAAKPYSVDANGMCDTAAWNAQPPSSVSPAIHLLPDSTIVDLEGIQYLKIGMLNFQGGLYNHISVHWPGYPLNFTGLNLGNVDVGLFTGAFLPFPSTMDVLMCQTCGLGTLPPFSGRQVTFILEDLSAQVLNLPPTLTHLTLFHCSLTYLPPLPNNLTNLFLNDNPVGYLPTLPATLTDLAVINSGLTSLPTLPPALNYLSAYGNSITAIAALPATLQHINVRDNQLTALPPLPPYLNVLDASNNPLTVLPPLTFINTLNVASCGLSTITLPNGVGQSLIASNNPLTSVPNLGSPQNVSLANCSLITCLPPLPNSLTTMSLGGSGVSCLPNIPPGLNTSDLGIPVVFCNVANSSCPPAYPVITGTTFGDLNSSGTFDFFEQVQPNSLVLAQPGELLTESDMSGNYMMPADIGTVSLTGLPGLYASVTTSPFAVTFTGMGQVDSLNDIGFVVIPGMRDLVTTLTGNNVRPGFNTALWVHVKNVGTQSTYAPAQLTFDPALSYISSTIAPQTINNNVLDWTTPVIQPGATWSVRVDFYAPPSLALGTAVMQTATATPSAGDQTPADNTAVLNDVVVGSFDPNDKRVTPELLMQQDVTVGTRLDYTIRFQNTGTFPAERVLITDTLPAGLQAASMQFIGSSHACTWYIKQRVLHVFFNNINLPDSTNDEANSHGYVRFTMKPSSTLLVGDAVENVANIYFDFNEPVITEPAIFYVETSLSAQEHEQRDLRAWPNPANGQLMVEFASGVPLEAMSVLDLQGRVVLQVPVVASERQTLDVTGIAPGAYLLVARTVNGSVSTRFVKQ